MDNNIIILNHPSQPFNYTAEQAAGLYQFGKMGSKRGIE